jgi:hypothetical protein
VLAQKRRGAPSRVEEWRTRTSFDPTATRHEPGHPRERANHQAVPRREHLVIQMRPRSRESGLEHREACALQHGLNVLHRPARCGRQRAGVRGHIINFLPV